MLSNEEFDKKMKVIEDGVYIMEKCIKSEKKLFEAYKFLLESEGISNG